PKTALQGDRTDRSVHPNITPAGQVQDGNNNCPSYTRNAHLKPQHLSAFSHLTSDPRAQYYCREVRRRAAGRTNRTRVRNQRYAALRELQRGESSKQSETLVLSLQHQSQTLVLKHWYSPRGMGIGASPLLSNVLAANRTLVELFGARLCVSHCTVCVVPPGVGLGAEGCEPTPQEKALLRDEFITQMYQRFLDGHDKDFNYRLVAGWLTN
uniref:CCD97-like C-terminal domain-containing protein n=1 Tax=Hucho hucho TaxID=62062 RepID=A0A4W5KNH6_9TELE